MYYYVNLTNEKIHLIHRYDYRYATMHNKGCIPMAILNT